MGHRRCFASVWSPSHKTKIVMRTWNESRDLGNGLVVPSSPLDSGQWDDVFEGYNRI